MHPKEGRLAIENFDPFPWRVFYFKEESHLYVCSIFGPYSCLSIGYSRTIAVLESVIGLVFVGLLARNGDESAEEGTSTTTRRHKTLEIKRIDVQSLD